jgi:DNA-binding transcriptional LysR family regulator
MNLHQLRIFAAVAHRMSFSAAARDLFMTQPAVSLQVRALENSLQVKLFDRSGSRLALTPAGEALLRSATTMLNAEAEARRAIDELREASKGTLVVGTNTTGGMYLLPRLLRAFRVANPEVEIVLDIDATDVICERVNERLLDLGFVGGPVEDHRLTVEPIADDAIVLIASPDNPLAQGGPLRLDDLATQRFVVQEPRSRTRLLVERRLREAGLNLRPAIQLTGTEAVKKAVEANLGVAFVSAYAIELELVHDRLRRLEVEHLAIARSIELIHPSRKYLTPALERFLRFVRAFAAAHLPPPAATPP